MEIILWFFGIIIVFIAVLELVKKSADKKAAQAEAEARGERVGEQGSIFAWVVGVLTVFAVVYLLFFLNPKSQQVQSTNSTITPTATSIQKNAHVLWVVNFRKEPTVTLKIGEDNDNYYGIIINRDKIKEGVTLERPLPSEYQPRVIDAYAYIGYHEYSFTIDDKTGVQSQVKLTFNSIDKKKKEADISIYVKLYETNKTNFIELKKEHIKVTGKDFDDLTNPPKKKKA